jgi:predicted CXXCH cytochrome family protein
VSKKMMLVSAALVVFVVVLMAFASIASAASGDHSNVLGTDHDLAVAGENPCEYCHLPHGAAGEFLWPTAPSTNPGATAVGASSSTAIKPLCYSCHDGTPTSVGLTTVFDPTKANHRTKAASTIRSSTGLPYGPGRDCDLCHDPHEVQSRHFIRYQRIGRTTVLELGGNICASCHSGSNGGMANHANNVDPLLAPTASTPTDQVWDPALLDFSGTRLFNPVSHYVDNAAGSVVHCETCHTPHGSLTDEDSINAMSTEDSALCINCHK